jgi:hypothetical protein
MIELPAGLAQRLGAQLRTMLGGDRLLEALKTWQGLFGRKGAQPADGMYEILEYESVLELKDRRGEVAISERRQKVRFLQDNIIAYEDQAWGDGELFADYHCSPGVPVDWYQDGAKWRVLISLRQSKRRGDVAEFRFTRRIKGGFTRTNEWLQTELSHRTDHLTVRVTFPLGRPCQHAELTDASANKTTELGPSCFSFLPDRRQTLTWEIQQPAVAKPYTIKWKW